MEERRCDYIVVGAGSAGCVLANRLSADGRRRVLPLIPTLSASHLNTGQARLWSIGKRAWHDPTSLGDSVGAVAILVPDYQEAIEYFVGTLGFTLVEDTRLSEEKRWVLVSPGSGTSLLLAKAKGRTPTRCDREPVGWTGLPLSDNG